MKHFCIIALLIVLLAFPSDVRADVAPPLYPPGSNPQPGAEITQVRMVAETVVIEVQRDITQDSLGWAQVSADFTMRNLSSVEESMAARFPLGADNGWTGYSELDNLRIKVNGKQVQYRRANYPDVRYQLGEVPWAEFDVTFPAGQDLSIQVSYDLQGSGYYPYTAFYYILETGAGWKDTIGNADIILRLPYEASPQNVILDMGIGWATTTPGAVFQGNEARWHFENFEPGENQLVQNMEFALVAPVAWQNVLNARANVDRSPNDGEAWGMLAKAYKEVFQMSKGYREDLGGQELYQLSVDAYENCLSLKPNDAQWHAGFADLLAERATWDAWVHGATPEAMRALEEIHTALELVPNDPVVRKIAENITHLLYGGISRSGEGFAFPWLTATPTSLPPTPTMMPVEEATATPKAPPTTDTPQANPIQVDTTEPNPTPVHQASNPICGSVAFLPLVALVWFARKQR
ncbi:MAG TPA: hypothetical protein VK897_02330 [Anaerolineales bacterium]|nr:hypothetical protein [Anaerolineales bacterium]